ncbi:hypothetical protein Talka_00394 [Tepidimonas alkaliphilus]|uniref:Uncharacterized protein n=1 Tax=Tepidimonas alkaliphilus TaxID=2588942 RepID=A0A554WDP8_9BURK|nr:hypothetical protein Talka_00388 [Tepidimonas alkaliphilus]TSE21714.1 hypothetical protein Talka_00394 [Tepidimonas alkaliphilus]
MTEPTPKKRPCRPQRKRGFERTAWPIKRSSSAADFLDVFDADHEGDTNSRDTDQSAPIRGDVGTDISNRSIESRSGVLSHSSHGSERNEKNSRTLEEASLHDKTPDNREPARQRIGDRPRFRPQTGCAGPTHEQHRQQTPPRKRPCKTQHTERERTNPSSDPQPDEVTGSKHEDANTGHDRKRYRLIHDSLANNSFDTTRTNNADMRIDIAPSTSRTALFV